jgi:ketosteroid isomerase-like protein
MSQENIELARRGYEAFNARDQEAFLALMDEDVVAESRLVAMEGRYVGHAGIRRWWDDFLGMFPDYTIEVQDLRDLGDDLLVVRFQAHTHGAASEVPLVDPAWHTQRWRDRRCVWWRVSTTEAEALEAAAQPPA